MNIFSRIIFHRKWAGSLVVVSILAGFFWISAKGEQIESQSPAFVIGVHHLGTDHLINRFYINKRIGDNVGEEGGGGSQVCCVKLPREFTRKITADVRWKVHRIIRPSDPSSPETEEVEGIYQAQVPIEPYTDPGNFYVHFFSDGRVRIVVSSITSDSELHPIRSDDIQASQVATHGSRIDAIFNEEDLRELQREIDHDRKKYGDWR